MPTEIRKTYWEVDQLHRLFPFLLRARPLWGNFYTFFTRRDSNFFRCKNRHDNLFSFFDCQYKTSLPHPPTRGMDQLFRRAACLVPTAQHQHPPTVGWISYLDCRPNNTASEAKKARVSRVSPKSRYFWCYQSG